MVRGSGFLQSEDGDDDRIINGYIKPDTAHNNSISMDSAEFVYQRVQELGVQLIVLTRWVAYACPVPRETYEAMAATSHVVAKRLLRVQQAKIEGLWSFVSWPIGNPKVRRSAAGVREDVREDVGWVVGCVCVCVYGGCSPPNE